MSATVADRQRGFDTALTVLALSIAIVTGILLTLRLAPVAPRPDAPALARVTFRADEVRRRPVGSLVWDGLEAGQELFAEDTVFVPPGGAATLEFADGARLELDANTLVVLERREREAPPTVALRQGGVFGRAGSGELSLIAADATARLGASGVARVQTGSAGTELSVLEGQAQLSSGGVEQRLGALQVARAERPGEVTLQAPLTVTLIQPSRDHRQPAGAGPVTFRWSSAAPVSIQLSRDPTFQRLHARSEGAAGDWTVGDLVAGPYWWRAVDAAGNARSETRRLVVVTDDAPRPTSPARGERFGLPPVPFTWTAVAGAPVYEVEIASDAAFQRLVAEERVGATSLRWPAPLRDGDYHWRVRARFEDRAGPWSTPRPFRILLQPLPDAPELIRPEIEVTPGDDANR